MATGEDAFAHSLCRTACLQLIYAQAESRSATAIAKAAASPSKPSNKPSARPPVQPDAVHIIDSAADTLADVLSAFLYQVGRSAIARTRLSGRTVVSLADAESALQAMAPATQSSLRDIARYASFQRISFPHSVPSFPVLPPPRNNPGASGASPGPTASSTQKPSTTTTSSGPNQTTATSSTPDQIISTSAVAERNRPYLEAWMPALPPAHTFIATPGELAPLPGPARAGATPAQRRRVEASLAVLRAGTVNPDLSASTAAKTATAGSRRVESLRPSVPGNPFFAPPVLEQHDEPVSAPREVRPEDVAPVAPAITESSSKATVSDVKRMRVERILAESGGTTGVPPGSGAGGGGGGAGPATPANVSTPIPLTPAPPTPGGDAVGANSDMRDIL